MRFRWLTLFLSVWLTALAAAQSTVAYRFSTLAGLPPGSMDGAGSAARFNYPTGIGTDTAGNVYVADTANRTIRKITPAGVTSTLAGQAGISGYVDGPGASALFGKNPQLTVDGQGNVYVIDSTNSLIRKITADGMVSSVSIGGHPTFGPLAAAADGTLYVVTFGTDTAILRITPQGGVSSVGTVALLPRALALGASGSLFIAESSAVRLMNLADGTSSVYAGNESQSATLDGTGTAARFALLQGIAYDATQNRLLVTDGSMIRQISAQQVVSLVAGSSGTGSLDGSGSGAQFDYPWGIAVDAAGTAYVTDWDACTVRKISPVGTVTTLAGLASPGYADGIGSGARFYEVEGMASDSAGNVYAADSFSGTVRKIGSNGAVSNAFPGISFGTPWGMVCDNQRNLYVVNSSGGSIFKISPNGSLTVIAGGNGTGFQDGPGTSARFSNPQGLARDPSGNLYVGDVGNNALRKISPTGVVTTVPGVTGSFGGLLCDANGAVYTGDNESIHRLNPDGSYVLVAGHTQQGSADGQGAAASFTFPTGMAFEASGNLLVVDSLSHTLRRVTPDGTVTTVAGRPAVDSFADGTGSGAEFDWPTGLAITPDGSIYVADSYNHVIRVSAGTPPTITTGLGNQTVAYGAVATFTVATAASASPLSYQWMQNGQIIPGATRATYSFTATLANTGPLSVTVTNLGGATVSTAVLMVTPVPPTIDYQPMSLTAAVGGSATFSVATSGQPAASYQWYFSGKAIAGATGSSYSVTNVTAANAGLYSVIIAGPSGTVTSNAASLAVVGGSGAPVITVQPTSNTVAAGGSAEFTFAAQVGPSGPTGSAYQWYFNGRPIAGATSSQLWIPAVASGNAGSYYAVATNGGSSIASDPVILSLSAAVDVGRLVNCSVLIPLTSAGQTLTLGITSQGTSGSEPLLIRGIGPALAAFGVAAPLPDPVLTVNGGTSVLATNSGWGTPATNATVVTAADTAVFAFPLSVATSLDAALVQLLPTNASYTVAITSAGGHVGSVLGEIYDATTSSFAAGQPHLINLSCLGQVPAQGTLTAGFTIAGSTATTVLIRASGPALAAFHVAGALADPQLTLHTAVSGKDTVVRLNSGWGGAGALVAAANASAAFPVADATSADAAIVATLNPGTYTAQVASASGAAGQVLVELFAVP